MKDMVFCVDITYSMYTCQSPVGHLIRLNYNGASTYSYY